MKKWWFGPNGIRSPFFATLITLLVIFIGGYASLYTAEIKNAFPFQDFDPETFCKSPALTFWVLTLLTGGLYFFREHSVEKNDSALRTEMINQIQTLPPSDFLNEFADLYDRGEALYEHALSSRDIEEVKKTIRGILTCLCQLTDTFDSPKQGTGSERYAANIMLFKDSTKLDQNAKTEIQSRIKFIKRDATISNLRGVLDVQKELSTDSSAQSSEIDSALVEFALPIPNDEYTEVGGERRSKILPGAPMSFCERRTELYNDTNHIYEWCEKNGDFTIDVKNQIREYFGGTDGKLIGSFLSLPLMKDRDAKPIGVINVHKTGSHLLVDEKRLRHFDPIIRPYRHMLTKLVMRLETLQNDPKTADKV